MAKETNILNRFMESMKAAVKAAPERDKELIAGLFLNVPKQASAYVVAVCEMETERTFGGSAATVAELDRNRSINHDALIAAVNACNRYCEAHGVPAIYSGGTSRREYGDYALQLAEELFINRK